MTNVSISVTPALKVNPFQYNVKDIEPLEDYSLIVARTTQDGFRFELPFMVENIALPLSADEMALIRSKLHAKVEARIKQKKVTIDG